MAYGMLKWDDNTTPNFAMQSPTAYIDFINTPTNKDSGKYKTAIDAAQKCLSMFNLICNGAQATQSPPSNTSSADELLKYKSGIHISKIFSRAVERLIVTTRKPAGAI